MRLLSCQAIEDFDGYEHAASLIRREKLHHSVMEGLIGEMKAAGVYPRVQPSAFKFWAEQIRKTNRQAALLRVEVEYFIVTQKLLHNPARPVHESPWERKHRVEEFWAVYHHRSLRKDSMTASAKSLEASDEECRSNLKSSSMRATYGMGFESGSMRWRVKDPPAGTISRLQYQKKGWLQEPPSSGIRSNGRQKSQAEPELGMGKSTSLPSLQPKPVTTPHAKTRAAAAAQKQQQQQPSSPSRKFGGDTLPMIAAGASRNYLKECDLRRTVPTPLSFNTGHSTSVHAVGRDLTDEELMAIVRTVSTSERVDAVELQGNLRLSDRSLVPLLQQFSCEEQLAESLQHLNVAGCVRVGPRTLQALGQLMDVTPSLRKLDISRVAISTRMQRGLYKAIGGHPHLSEVNLADTGLGSTMTMITKECITSLLGSRSIQSLNLGWNCFNAEVFTHLGHLVVQNPHLRALCVENCAASVAEAVTPIALFLEVLARDATLTRLDLAINRIDYRSALIIEDSFDHHRKLQRLGLAQNPLGVLGMRSVLRLLARDHTGLMHTEIESCHSQTASMEGEELGGSHGKALSPDVGSGHTFHYTNPGGKYVLNLARPYDRTMLRMLYKTSERFGLPPDKAFVNISFVTPPPKPPAKLSYAHPSKDSHGIYEVPTQGILTLVFNVQEAVEAAMKGIGETDFSGFLDRHFELMRFHPGWKKVVPLFARYKDLEGRVQEQACFVNALGKDFNLNLQYLQQMCRSDRSFANEAITRLSPCMPATSACRYLALMRSAKLSDYLWTHKRLSTLLDFNANNPTGHYRLHLESSSDFATAERLLLLDRWEAAIDLRHERYDVSSRGNASHFRNELYQGRPLGLHYSSVAEWTLPEVDIFEFDYSSNQRPPQGARPVSDGLWEALLLEMHHSGCTPEEKIAVLRSVAHLFFISSMQMRQLIGYFRTPEQRAEVFVAFYLRIVDFHNAKLCRVRFESQEEIMNLTDRLGYASFFPFLQPENCRFELDLSYSDQRLCASILVALSIKEKVSNIREPEWTHRDGTKDPLTLGIPRSWESHARVPTDGVLKGTYVCAPEDRKFELRKEFAEKYGFFKSNAAEEDVQWWTGLTEPPPDVLEFLEFLLSRVSHVNEAFTIIDGADGNGEITLREMEDGFRELKCHKFKGKDEKLRIGNLFRYLDMGGEGSVSLHEWQLLDQLWKEMDLSITEFVHFLELTVSADLAECFARIDEDGGGELSEEEWVEAIKDIGYFGPAKVVFALLDSSDDGNISLEEFMVLQKYQSKRAA